MSDEHSITRMLSDLKGGDELAAQQMWERFFHRVCGLARKRLGEVRERVADEEDIALSAMNALCVGARDGRFRQLEDRDDLWQVLAMITVRKAANVWRRQKARNEGGESLLGVGADGQMRGVDQILQGGNDALLMNTLTESSEALLSLLDPKLQRIAQLKFEGYRNEEIADEVNRSVKSIERYLAIIREKWRPHLEEAGL